MNVIETKDFNTQLLKLPKHAQGFARLQLHRFRANRNDPRLHIKKLVDMDGVHSFRITRAYRALYYFDSNKDVILFTIGHRKNIYS